MNSKKISDHPEQDNLKVLYVVNSEINLMEVENISEGDKNIINEMLKNKRKDEKMK